MMNRRTLSNILKKALAGKRLPISVITLSAASWLALSVFPVAGPAQAQPPAAATSGAVQNMTYEVYAGGINAVTATLNIGYEAQERYHLSLSAWTKGFLGRLAPWSGTFKTTGWLENGEARMPEMHQSTAIWRQEEEIKTYSYSADGRFNGLTVIEKGHDKSPESIDDELTQGTIDALTATLQVMETVAAGQGCNGSAEVFDGARRFELIFREEAREMLESSRYNIYEGEALRCAVEVKPIAGKWHEKPRGWMSIQEQGREKGTMPTVWLAPMSDGTPAIPVKVRVKTDYGTLFMHLAHYQNGDQAVQAGR